MITKVLNLRTSEEVGYSMPPEKAVVLAFRQLTEKNFNWWNEGYYDVPITEGEKTVSCGDWCAIKNPCWDCDTDGKEPEECAKCSYVRDYDGTHTIPDY